VERCERTTAQAVDVEVMAAARHAVVTAGLHPHQGLTLVHFLAQLEPCLTHKNTPHTLLTPKHPFNMG